MRVLVVVKPQMYREALAGVLRGHRPDDEVMVVPPEELGGGLTFFGPDLLVHNDTDEVSPRRPWNPSRGASRYSTTTAWTSGSS